MAGIIKRGELQYEARIRIKGFPGRSATFETRVEAIAWAAPIEAEIRAGRYVDRRPQERMSLSDALDRYLKTISCGKRSAPSETYRIRKWQANSIASRPLSSLRGSDFARYRDDRLVAGVSSATVRLELALVGHLFEICRKEWGMESLSNPVRNIRLPPTSTERERRLNPGEYETILKAIRATSRKPWLAAAFTLAIETALRQSVLVQMRWSWVDLDARLLRIPREFRDQENKGVPTTLPLWDPAIAVLRSLPRCEHDDRVLQFTAVALRLAWNQVRQSPDGAPFRDLRWHDLRHEAASRLTEQGMHTLEIRAITGHKSMQMLARYTHVPAVHLLNKYAPAATRPPTFAPLSQYSLKMTFVGGGTPSTTILSAATM